LTRGGGLAPDILGDAYSGRVEESSVGDGRRRRILRPTLRYAGGGRETSTPVEHAFHRDTSFWIGSANMAIHQISVQNQKEFGRHRNP
jgi:hypothetical protein